jgi:hypothetical protein
MSDHFQHASDDGVGVHVGALQIDRDIEVRRDVGDGTKSPGRNPGASNPPLPVRKFSSSIRA